jgi:hypothetical protein
MDHEHLQRTATAILEGAFEVPPGAWMSAHFDARPVALLFYYELHEISLSEKILSKHPEAQEYLDIFPQEFIRQKHQEASKSIELAPHRLVFHHFLDRFPEEERLYLHRCTIYDMHCLLMSRDFGDMYASLSSPCQGLTKDAEKFIRSTQNSEV